MKNKVLVLIFCMGVCLPYKIYSHDWLPSDSLFFSSLRLDIPDMLNVRNSVEKGDYSAAKFLLLQYKRLAGGGKWFMEPFVAEVEGFASGKTIGLFGSFGWGDGQWMRDWEDRMKAAGAEVACGEGIITQETPDDDALVKCKELGKTLAAV